jgi:hypothetical protein
LKKTRVRQSGGRFYFGVREWIVRIERMFGISNALRVTFSIAPERAAADARFQKEVSAPAMEENSRQ